MKRSLALWAGVLLLISVSMPVEAHNGAVAIAVPMEGVAIDGDLSDRPKGMPRYQISAWDFGDKPKNQEDFQGSTSADIPPWVAKGLVFFPRLDYAGSASGV